MQSFHVTVVVILAQAFLAMTGFATEWRIPLAGNAYKSAPGPGKEGFLKGGVISWSKPENVYSVFVHSDRPAKFNLSLVAAKALKDSEILVRVGERKFTLKVDEGAAGPLSIGVFEADQAGYVRIDLQGKTRDGETYGAFDAMILKSDTEGLIVDYVRDNEGNMFYWGRRGPSAHLRYKVPAGRKIQYAYNEVTVPDGEDAIGSYFMANGFSQGYFGIQVNSSTERRVLFSVWSPYKTDNPREIPEDQRIEALAQGTDVHVGKFGNEGSGGQSYLRYPWKAGQTYRFLTEVRPDGAGKTIYTSWFGDKAANEWRLIASFRRPKTDTHLKGFHSFIENFNPVYGHIGRRANYGNTWVRDTEGQWHECLEARFSVDATGNGRHRLDFQGGVFEGAFFLQNCGFFNESGAPGETCLRNSSEEDGPGIDLEILPGG